MRRRFVCLLVPALLVVLSLGAMAAEPELPRVERGQPLPPCPRPVQEKGYVAQESRGAGFTVDACGRKVDGTGELMPSSAAAGLTATAPLTIDRMTTSHSGSHAAGGALTLVGSASVYFLSDGSQWSSGAGSYYTHAAQLDRSRAWPAVS